MTELILSNKGHEQSNSAKKQTTQDEQGCNGNHITANFIGCGKLGQTLAYLWAKNNLITIKNIYSRSLESAQSAIQFIGQGEVCTNLNLLNPADFYFICTPDDAIETICQQIIKEHKPNKNAIFIHFSGLLTSSKLKSAEDCGYSIVSLHPIKSFALPKENIKNFNGTYCAYEGSSCVFETIKELIQKIGGHVFCIQQDSKPLYHAAAVFSSNYIVTLAHIASLCFKKAGVLDDEAKNILISLMQGTLNNLSKLENIQDALTGPIQRGDINSIKAHLEALEFNHDFKAVYNELGRLTMEMTTHSSEFRLELFKKSMSINST